MYFFDFLRKRKPNIFIRSPNHNASAYIMKRFLIAAPGAASKKAKPGEEGGTDAGVTGEQRGDPETFVTWNGMSVLGRFKNDDDKAAFFKYINEHNPDVIALQETWLPAATNPTR